MRPSIYGREHAKIDSSLASLRSRHFVGRLGATISHVTLSL